MCASGITAAQPAASAIAAPAAAALAAALPSRGGATATAATAAFPAACAAIETQPGRHGPFVCDDRVGHHQRRGGRWPAERLLRKVRGGANARRVPPVRFDEMDRPAAVHRAGRHGRRLASPRQRVPARAGLQRLQPGGSFLLQHAHDQRAVRHGRRVVANLCMRGQIAQPAATAPAILAAAALATALAAAAQPAELQRVHQPRRP